MRYLGHTLRMHQLLVLIVLDKTAIEVEIIQKLLTSLDSILRIMIQLKILLKFCYDFWPDLFPPIFQLPLGDLQLLGPQHFGKQNRINLRKRVLSEYLVNLRKVICFHNFIFEDVNNQECNPDHDLLALQQERRQDEHFCLVVHAVEG